MSTNENFFRERKAAAVLKHGVLRRYAGTFTGAAGSVASKGVSLVDGYAGPGRCEDGSPGSPALLLEACAAISFRDTKCIFVEREKKEFDQLAGLVETSNVTKGRDDEALCGDIAEHVDHVLEESKGRALLAFFDPFGPALPRTELSRILGRPSACPTEVLVHVSLLTIARVGGAVVASETSGLPAHGAERVDTFMGGDWWRQRFKDHSLTADSATHAAEEVAGEFAKRLIEGSSYGFFRVPVRETPTALPKYELVLFSVHKYGFWAFNEAVSSANVEWQQAWRDLADAKKAAKAKKRDESAGRLSLFPDFEEYQTAPYNEREHWSEWVAEIRTNIERLAASKSEFRIIDHTGVVYGRVLGLARTRHVREAVKELHRSGLIDNNGVGDDFYKRPTRTR